jgi:serine/threonine-protein kinase HipA
MKQAAIYVSHQMAGMLIEDENGFTFTYFSAYLTTENPQPISKTMPITSIPYSSTVLFPFFDGLIPEGWLLDVAEKSWKINNRDRMSLLLVCCKDCIGNVSVVAQNEEDEL